VNTIGHMNHYIFDLDDTLILHRNDIHYEWICEDHVLTHYLKKCIGTKYIYTNGTIGHAEDVLRGMNITDEFHSVYSRDSFEQMKPSLMSAVRLQRGIRRDLGDKIIFFDDLLDNLLTGKLLGWITVWISPNHELKGQYTHVDYAFPNVIDALKYIQENDVMPRYDSI
jgi:putative hydrolase of the HAD superfamily